MTAHVSYQLGAGIDITESYLLDTGRRLKALNFNKALWVEIQAELSEIDWAEMEETAALCVFMEELVPLLERHVPVKPPRKKTRNRIDRTGKLLWRKLI